MSTTTERRFRKYLKRRLKKSRKKEISSMQSIELRPDQREQGIAPRRFSCPWFPLLLMLRCVSNMLRPCLPLLVMMPLAVIYVVPGQSQSVSSCSSASEVIGYVLNDSIDARDVCDRLAMHHLVTWSGGRSAARQKRPRSKAEIRRERKELWEKTNLEIDEIVAEFHALLPRSAAKSIGAIYARYSSRHQDSIADQVRAILKYAVQEGIFVPREMIKFDLAVRGYTQHRIGLDELRQILEQKKVGVLLLFATNRVFRKTYRTLEFVDTVHESWRIRIIFVKNGIDSSDEKRWKQLLHMNALFDEFYVEMYVDNIHAAHEGLLHNRMVFGTISFGYWGEPIPGEFTKRNRPRCRIRIDEESATVVRQIFNWYVVDLLTLEAIIHRLNDGTYPLPPRTNTEMWSRDAVRGVLKNPRYRGYWEYGVKEAVYLPDKDYVRQRLRAEPLAAEQIEELRIVSDELWFAAQERLAEERRKCGRTPKSGKRGSRPRILNGLVCCGAKDHKQLYANGPSGKSMICPVCKRLPPSKRYLFTQLSIAQAIKLLCDKLATLVRLDDGLIRDVIAASQRHAAALQLPDPKKLGVLLVERERLTRAIDFIQRNVGESVEDQSQSAKNLSEYRADRAKISSQIATLESAQARTIRIPTEEDVRAEIGRVQQILVDATSGVNPDQAEIVREILRLLTGGRIELHQQGERKQYRGWLQGRFSIRLVDAVARRVTGERVDSGMEFEVVIEFFRPDMIKFDADADRAFIRYEAGALDVDIAIELQCCRNRVARLLKHAAEKRGIQLLDGRSRRRQLEHKQQKEPKHVAIADIVEVRVRQGVLLCEIADELCCDRNLITKTVKYLRRVRGLDIPEGRTRRKMLGKKTRHYRRRKSGCQQVEGKATAE